MTNFDAGITFVLDSKNPRLTHTKKSEKEIQVLHYKNGWTIVNVSDDCYVELAELIWEFWLDDAKIWQLLQRKYQWTLDSYYSVRLYLFTDEKLIPVDKNIRKLERSESALFDAFMEKCSKQERYEVYMDFNESFHNFYAYFEEGDIVSLWEYSKIHDEDDIVVLSIITREDCRGRWYGKAVVNAMTHKIIEQWLVPQYRVDPKNIASRNLAKSLWYEEILEWYSLRIEVI